MYDIINYQFRKLEIKGMQRFRPFNIKRGVNMSEEKKVLNKEDLQKVSGGAYVDGNPGDANMPFHPIGNTTMPNPAVGNGLGVFKEKGPNGQIEPQTEDYDD